MAGFYEITDAGFSSSLSALMQIPVPVRLQVTFAVKPLLADRSSVPSDVVPPTATPVFLSPLATPTP